MLALKVLGGTARIWRPVVDHQCQATPVRCEVIQYAVAFSVLSEAVYYPAYMNCDSSLKPAGALVSIWHYIFKSMYVGAQTPDKPRRPGPLPPPKASLAQKDPKSMLDQTWETEITSVGGKTYSRSSD